MKAILVVLKKGDIVYNKDEISKGIFAVKEQLYNKIDQLSFIEEFIYCTKKS